MIRPKVMAGLLLASVTMLGLGGCTKVVQVPVPAGHHDDGHDRDHHPPPPPPQNRHDQGHDNDHPNAPPPPRRP